MPTSPCLAEDVLTALTADHFPETVVSIWKEHLRLCPECRARATWFQEHRQDDHSQQMLTASSMLESTVSSGRPPEKISAESQDVTAANSSSPADEDSTQPTTDMNTDSLLIVGSTLGPYQLLSKLGEGGMGTVYKARHSRLDKLVALKVLTPRLTQHEEFIARFSREMRAIGKLEHPHIVRSMDAGDQNGVHYLAMEFVEGLDLSATVKQTGPFDVPRACEVLRQTALALSAAHQAGLVHRDLKPSNLLLNSQGQVKLLDLGLALLTDESQHQEELTLVGQAYGTPDYMAPEQWADSHAVDARTDLYALGCTLYFLLVGRSPYASGNYQNSLEKLKAHSLLHAPDLRAVRHDIPDGVSEIYQKLMAKNPADRFQTASEVAAALTPFAVSTTGHVTVGGHPFATRSASEGEQMSAYSRGNHSLPPRNVTRQLLAAGLGGLLLCGILIIITNKSGQKTTIEVPAGTQIKVAAQPGDQVQIVSDDTHAMNPAAWMGWPENAPLPAIAPFTAEQAAQRQQDWAQYLQIPVTLTNSIGMRFQLIPPGEFLMGSTPEEIQEILRHYDADDKLSLERTTSEGPRHKVVITQPFYLAATEVTQAQYLRVMGANPSFFSSRGEGQELVANQATESLPVEMVDWHDAVQFCNRLSQQETLLPCYSLSDETWNTQNGTGYRLPLEGEWEYACRSGTTTVYSAGDTDVDLEAVGWTNTNAQGRTHPTGRLKPNAFGIYDMHGNVREWLQDGWDAAFYQQFQNQPAVDPFCPLIEKEHRTIRGGDWNGSLLRCRSADRVYDFIQMRGNYLGFRVVLLIPPRKGPAVPVTNPE